MFCVECGREDELVGPLCKECYSRKHALVELPPHVDVTLCAHCSSMLTERGWEDIGSVREAVEVAIEEALVLLDGSKVSDMRVALSEKDERNMEAKVTLLLSAEGHDFEREAVTAVRIKRGSCSECSKQQGKYYEAILQVRGADRGMARRTEDEVESLVRARVYSMRKGSREVFLSKVDRVKGGLDFYFSTIPAAKSVARELQETMCGEYKESSSLWGRKDGRDIYRATILVRLPGYAVGDVIEMDARAFLVTGMMRGMVHVVDLASGEARSIRHKDTSSCSVLRRRTEILKATVVLETERELQVVDPETMGTIDVAKPKGFHRKGEQVRVAKTSLGIFAISDSW